MRSRSSPTGPHTSIPRGACLNHYDLFARPDWKARSVLVVTPYVEREFFRRLVKDLRPRLLTVVVDDGCRPDDVAMLRALRARGRDVKVALGGATGLVHAKVFHIEWETPGGRTAHTLVYGSGNATRQAFHGGINAELMCRARLTAASHRSVLDWAQAVREAAAAAAGGDVPVDAAHEVVLADGILLRLPAIVVKDATAKASNFDLWLQRGRLAAAFRPDPSFLRVHINLRAELPPGAVEQSVLDVGFETLRTRRLSIPYLQATEGLDDEPDVSGLWRSRFFLLTQLGDWCSATCHAGRGSTFRKAGHEGRGRTVALLKGLADPARREQVRLSYLARVERLWAALGENAGEYLSSKEGHVDLEEYGRLFEHRVEYDLELVADDEFCTRFVDGVEIIDVPRFRVDASAWDAFVQSFARQLHIESIRRRSVSLVYQRVSAALVGLAEDPFEDPRQTTMLLRRDWNKLIEDDEGQASTVGAYIDAYQNLGC